MEALKKEKTDALTKMSELQKQVRIIYLPQTSVNVYKMYVLSLELLNYVFFLFLRLKNWKKIKNNQRKPLVLQRKS